MTRKESIAELPPVPLAIVEGSHSLSELEQCMAEAQAVLDQYHSFPEGWTYVSDPKFGQDHSHAQEELTYRLNQLKVARKLVNTMAKRLTASIKGAEDLLDRLDTGVVMLWPK